MKSINQSIKRSIDRSDPIRSDQSIWYFDVYMAQRHWLRIRGIQGHVHCAVWPQIENIQRDLIDSRG